MKQPYFYEKNGLLYTKSGLNFHFQPTYLSDICFFTVLLLNLWEKFPHLALPVHPSPAGFPVPVSFQKSQETSVFLSLTHPEIFFSSVKCIFKFYLARVNSIPVEFTSAWIFPSSFYKILLQMIPCLCRRRIK